MTCAEIDNIYKESKSLRAQKTTQKHMYDTDMNFFGSFLFVQLQSIYLDRL